MIKGPEMGSDGLAHWLQPGRCYVEGAALTQWVRQDSIASNRKDCLPTKLT